MSLSIVTRVYQGQSVTRIATFVDAANAPVDVTEPRFFWTSPTEIMVVTPPEAVVRLGVGTYASAMCPVLAGRWSVVARCTGPAAAVDLGLIEVVSIPAGALPPPQPFVTTDDSLFLILSPDGALVTR
ncbi:hypothetical protein [Roseomonas sp. BN140053]|uniref:hypothetical protein n=1 Tax=Roseomonas sp. BN140053 TaxID=3391898 RepID=UPI0039E8A4D9